MGCTLRLNLYSHILLTLILFSLINFNISSFVQPEVKIVTNQTLTLGEGPYWDSENQLLYLVDAGEGNFVRLNPVTGQLTKVFKGQGVQFIIPYQKEKGAFIVNRKHEILKLNFDQGTSVVIASVRPETPERENFNDAKCDPKGRLFVGSFLFDEQGNLVPKGGALYRLDGDKVTRVAQGFSASNGLAFSNDHKKLYFNDSEGRVIYQFDYNVESGELSNQQVLIDLDKSSDFRQGEFPDGMIVDNQGYIWTCMWKGGRIVKIDPDLAQVVDQVILPNIYSPTSLAAGTFEGKFGYFVTTATFDVPPEKLTANDGKILHVSFQGGEVNAFVP